MKLDDMSFEDLAQLVSSLNFLQLVGVKMAERPCTPVSSRAMPGKPGPVRYTSDTQNGADTARSGATLISEASVSLSMTGALPS